MILELDMDFIESGEILDRLWFSALTVIKA